MQKLIFLLTTIAALALGGCGQPTHAGSGAKSATEAGSSAGGGSIRRMLFGKDVKATVSEPAGGLILNALLTPAQIQRLGLLWRGGLPGVAPEIQHDWIFNTGAAQDSGTIEKLFLQQVAEAKKNHSTILPEALAAKSPAGLLKVWRDQRLLVLLTIPAAPYRGWEVDVPMGFGKPSPQAKARLNFYLALQEAAAHYSSQVLSLIAAKVSVHAWQDPSVAKAAIRKIYFAMDPDQLQSTWLADWKQAQSGGQRVINMTGGGAGSVEWSGPDGSFSGQPAGLVWERDGQTWLGDGFLAGKKYEIGLASTMGSSMEKSSGEDSKTGNGVAIDASGTSQVQ